MRINELNMFQKMFGKLGFGGGAPDTSGVGSAILRGRKSGLSPEDQLAQDTFVKRFVSRGANALNTAVQQGLVDVNSADLGADSGAAEKEKEGETEPTAEPTAEPAAEPAAGAAGATEPATAPAAGAAGAPASASGPSTAAKPSASAAAGATKTSGAAKAAGGKPQVDVNVDTAIKAMRTLQPTGTRKLPEKNAAELNKTLQYVSKNKDYLLLAADKINKFNSAGYDMKPFHNTFMQQFALGKKQKTIQEERLLLILNKLLTEANFRIALARRGYDPNIVTSRITNLLEELSAPPGIDPLTGKPWATKGQPAAPAKKKPKAAAKPVVPAKKPVDQAKAMKRNPGDFARVAGSKQPKPAAPAAATKGTSPATAPATKATSPATAPAAGASEEPATAPATAPAAGAAGEKPSAGAWLRDNFMKGFLRGIDLGSSKAQVDNILKDLPNAIKSGTVNKSLTDIANIAWAVSDQGRKQDSDPAQRK